MASYLQWFAVDWNWSELDEAQRSAVRRSEALLQADPAGATVDWLADVLSAASAALDGRALRAACEDEMDAAWVIEARGGRAVLQEPEGELLATFERLRDAASHELFPETLSVEDFKAAGIEKVSRMLFFPRPVLAEIRRQAVRTDRSISWMVQSAWKSARERIAALADPAAFEAELAARAAAAGGPAHPDSYAQSLFLGIEMIAELDALARRLGASQSQLMILAWALAADDIAAQPSSQED